MTWARLPGTGRIRLVGHAAGRGADVRGLPATPATAPCRSSRAGLLPATSSRAGPYIYAQQDLDALLAACSAVFRHGFVADTMHAIVGLLAATGMRIGEALRLAVSDITADADSGGGAAAGPGQQARSGPAPAGRCLDHRRAGRLPGPARAPACPACAGRAAVRHQEWHWLPAVDHRGVFPAPGSRCRAAVPRTGHSPGCIALRHSFTTGHIAAAYRSGTDAQRTLTLLSTWLGHTSPAHTYWYLTATPELMALAAGRLASQPAGFGEGTPR